MKAGTEVTIAQILARIHTMNQTIDRIENRLDRREERELTRSDERGKGNATTD